MQILINEIIQPKTAEDVRTTQYTSNNVKTLIDKLTAYNYSGTAATLAVNLVPASGTVSNDNLLVTANILPGQTYLFPEIVGKALFPGGFISTLAGSASALGIAANGRTIS